MRKRRLFYAAPWVLACTLPMLSSCSGREADLARLAATVINEDTTIVSIVYGRATDAQGVPLKGVQVKLLGDRFYETETNEDGYYRFEGVFIASGQVFIGSGESGSTSETTGYLSATASYVLLFKDERNRLATFRTTATLNANIYRTANSYAYEAIPYLYNATLVPFAEFQVKVLTGAADGAGEPLPAEGALVEVRPGAGTDSALFDTYSIQRTANAQGVALFDARARLAAAAGYIVIVYPYDSDPDAPGYEYDAVVTGADLTPYSIFTPGANGAYQLNELVVVLRDGVTTNAPPTIAFSEPAAGDAIGPQTPITVYFSRSVDPTTIQYRLEACDGTALSCNGVVNGTDIYILTEELDRKPLKVALKPIDELTRIFPSFQLHVQALTYDGVAFTPAAIGFTLSDALTPDRPDVPTPELALSSIDSSQSLDYYAAVDAGAVYVFDTTAFDDTTYKGPLYAASATSAPNWTNPAVAAGLDIWWRAVEDVAGYRVFGRDGNHVTSWVQLDNVGPNVRPPWDDRYVATTLANSVMAMFDYYNDAAITPFCCGNAVQIAVLPYYAQSGPTPETSGEMTMASLNPNRILSLSDNYGPAVMTQGLPANYGARTTTFAGLDYDAVARVAMSEYMDHTANPVLDPATTEAASAGVTRESGRFDMEWIRWDDQSANTAWTVQLSPAVVSASALYVGDKLVNSDGSGTCTVTFLDFCRNNTRVFCGGTELIGPTYQLLGPVRDGPDPTVYDFTNAIATAHVYLLAEEPADETFLDEDSTNGWPRWAFVDDAGTVLAFANPDEVHASPEPVVYMDTTPADGFDIVEDIDFAASGAVSLSNHPTRSLRAASVPDDGELLLDSIQGANARVVTLLDGADTEMVEITVTDDANQAVTIAGSKFSHAAGTTVAFYPIAPLLMPADPGDDTITVDDPNGVAGTDGYFEIGMWIEIGTGAAAEVVEITNVAGPVLSIDRDPAGGAADDPLVEAHLAGEMVRLVGGSVEVLGVGASVDTVTGLAPGASLIATAGLSNTEPYGTATYTICAMGTVDDDGNRDDIGGIVPYLAVFAETNDEMHRIDPNGVDEILPFDPADLRPADVLRVRGKDAAGNPMRSNGALLRGDGTVE